MDRILVMVDGKISESGTYKELLEQKGAFSEFLRMHAPTENDSELCKNISKLHFFKL